MKVLLADDSPTVRARLAAMLREVPDVEVREAGSAAAALHLVLGEAPDVVVLDVHMPGGSGIDVIAPIKAAVPPPVVVVLTGHPTDQIRRASLARGADLFLDKATDFAVVVELVRVRRR